MASAVASGSQTATIGVEHTLDTRAAAGVYLLKVDLGNLAAGDVLELRVKDKGRPADGANKQADVAVYAHGQGSPIIQTIPVASDSVAYTLKQTAGTGRVFTWSVWSI